MAGEARNPQDESLHIGKASPVHLESLGGQQWCLPQGSPALSLERMRNHSEGLLLAQGRWQAQCLGLSASRVMG